MILDERIEFADATSVAAAAGTVVIGDVIDLTTSGLGLGMGEPVWLIIQTTTEIITAGAAGTLQFFIVSDALSTLGAGVLANCTEHARTAVLVTDDAAANSAEFNVGGVIMAVYLPVGVYERYLGILATTATTTTTAGAINAFLTRDYARWTALPDATN